MKKTSITTYYHFKLILVTKHKKQTLIPKSQIEQQQAKQKQLNKWEKNFIYRFLITNKNV